MAFGAVVLVAELLQELVNCQPWQWTAVKVVLVIFDLGGFLMDVVVMQNIVQQEVWTMSCELLLVHQQHY